MSSIKHRKENENLTNEETWAGAFTGVGKVYQKGKSTHKCTSRKIWQKERRSLQIRAKVNTTPTKKALSILLNKKQRGGA